MVDRKGRAALLISCGPLLGAVSCCTGRSGRSISLVTQYDVEVVQKIEALIGKQLDEFTLDEEDVLEYFKETLVAKRKARMVSAANYFRPRPIVEEAAPFNKQSSLRSV